MELVIRSQLLMLMIPFQTQTMESFFEYVSVLVTYLSFIKMVFVQQLKIALLLMVKTLYRIIMEHLTIPLHLMTPSMLPILLWIRSLLEYLHLLNLT